MRCVSPVAYRSFLSRAAIGLNPSRIKVPPLSSLNKASAGSAAPETEMSTCGRVVAKRPTPVLRSLCAPKYVIMLILTVLCPITSPCCQILAIIQVLLDGYEREVIVISGVRRLRFRFGSGGRYRMMCEGVCYTLASSLNHPPGCECELK